MDSEDVYAAFHKSAEDDKLLSFEASTLALVLRRSGMTAMEVKSLRREKGESFSFDWFNEEGFLEFEVHSTRFFRFNFPELFFTPTKSPVFKHLQEFSEQMGQRHFALIFRVYDAGRVVASNFKPFDVEDGVCLSIGGGAYDPFYITTFDGFFSYYGSIMEERKEMGDFG